jgi:16S rRNA (adenine1518-N6/adenine1519-N6)-dimethyltransferase
MVKPKKHLGQHFLTDQNIAQRTAELALKCDNTNVLEIGPGKGILTKHLLKLPNKIINAIEIDHESTEFLQSNQIIQKPQLIEGDFLNLQINQLFPEPFILIGNFPYNISSQIVFKMLENHRLIPFMAGMFQKEVAYRIASPPGSKEYGILSVLTQAFYDVKVEFKIAPGAFFPPPKVDSAVISCKHKPNPEIGCNEKKLFDVVKTAFNQRRKTLSNSLHKYNLKEAFLNHPFAKLRPENLSVGQFIELTQYIEKNNQ